MTSSDALLSYTQHICKSGMPRFLPFASDHCRANLGLLQLPVNDCLGAAQIVALGGHQISNHRLLEAVELRSSSPCDL